MPLSLVSVVTIKYKSKFKRILLRILCVCVLFVMFDCLTLFICFVEMSSLNYLESDMKGIKFGKKKLSKQVSSNELKGTPELRGMDEGSNDVDSEIIFSEVEIMRDGPKTVIKFLYNPETGNNVAIEDDIKKILSHENTLIEEKLKLVKSYQYLRSVHSETINELSLLKEDRKILITKVIPHVVGRLLRSQEFCSALGKLMGFAIRLGRQQSLEAFREAYLEDQKEELDNNDPTAYDKFMAATKEFEETQFPYINKVASNFHRSAKDIMEIAPLHALPRV